MSIDEHIYRLPLLGQFMRRLYSYFKKHILFTDLIHISIGLGIGLLIANLIVWGIVFIVLGLLGHIWAFIKGDSEYETT